MRKGLQGRALFPTLLILVTITACSFNEDEVLDVSRGLPVPGAVLWLRADRGVDRDAANFVSRWLDQSASGNNAISSVKPLWIDNAFNDKPAIQFFGSEYLILPDFLYSPNVTVFMVNRCPGQPNQQYLFCDYGDVPQKKFIIRVIASVNTIEFSVQDNALFNINVGSFYDSSFFHILTGIINNQTAQLYYNGLSDNSSTNTSYDSTTMWIGSQTDMYPTIGKDSDPAGTSYLIGDIAEIVIYNRALSYDDRRKIERYLSEKYKIPLWD